MDNSTLHDRPLLVWLVMLACGLNSIGCNPERHESDRSNDRHNLVGSSVETPESGNTTGDFESDPTPNVPLSNQSHETAAGIRDGRYVSRGRDFNLTYTFSGNSVSLDLRLNLESEGTGIAIYALPSSSGSWSIIKNDYGNLSGYHNGRWFDDTGALNAFFREVSFNLSVGEYSTDADEYRSAVVRFVQDNPSVFKPGDTVRILSNVGYEASSTTVRFPWTPVNEIILEALVGRPVGQNARAYRVKDDGLSLESIVSGERFVFMD